MDPLRHFFSDWFGYSRKDRRSTFILLIIIVLITGSRYLVPADKFVVSEIPVITVIPYNDQIIIQPLNDVDVTESRKEYENYTRYQDVIDLNYCDSASLEGLPGIGPVLSSRIIKYRNLIGGFVSVGQLREVYGLSEETFEMISSRLKADSSAVRKININNAEFKDLIRHPYLKRNEINAILKYRELNGNITDIVSMTENNLITPETANKIRGYLDFAP
jgi:DNA uptake protein ComE-like DNA-binding protein